MSWREGPDGPFHVDLCRGSQDPLCRCVPEISAPPTVTHRGGVPWWKAPLPRRLHRCRPWTTGSTGWLTHVDRCACGAIRLDPGYPWMQRNSRRRTAT